MPRRAYKQILLPTDGSPLLCGEGAHRVSGADLNEEEDPPYAAIGSGDGPGSRGRTSCSAGCGAVILRQFVRQWRWRHVNGCPAVYVTHTCFAFRTYFAIDGSIPIDGWLGAERCFAIEACFTFNTDPAPGEYRTLDRRAATARAFAINDGWIGSGGPALNRLAPGRRPVLRGPTLQPEVRPPAAVGRRYVAGGNPTVRGQASNP